MLTNLLFYILYEIPMWENDFPAWKIISRGVWGYQYFLREWNKNSFPLNSLFCNILKIQPVTQSEFTDLK